MYNKKRNEKQDFETFSLTHHHHHQTLASKLAAALFLGMHAWEAGASECREQAGAESRRNNCIVFIPGVRGAMCIFFLQMMSCFCDGMDECERARKQESKKKQKRKRKRKRGVMIRKDIMNETLHACVHRWFFVCPACFTCFWVGVYRTGPLSAMGICEGR